jgi:hypothetical protein
MFKHDNNYFNNSYSKSKNKVEKDPKNNNYFELLFDSYFFTKLY